VHLTTPFPPTWTDNPYYNASSAESVGEFGLQR
jgi:hypothetical protein